MMITRTLTGRPVGRRGEVAVVVGTRSEAVALAPVVRVLRRCSQLAPLVVSTGQQRGALDQVLRPLGVRPDVDLAAARTRPELAARRLAAEEVERLGELLVARRPSAVLVHGDSATAFGAALAASSEGIGVGHLGAGLRPAAARPGPEDANRRLIAPLARWHLAPTPLAAARLVDEGIDPAAVTVTGTTGVDALLWAASLQRGTSAFDRARGHRRAARRVLACLQPHDPDGARLVSLVAALGGLAAEGVDVVLPLHPDTAPDVLGSLIGTNGVRALPPLDYLDFVATMRDATLVVTDSGAVEEEAPSLGVPVVVVRDDIDPVRAITGGLAQPAGSDVGTIVERCRALLSDAAAAPADARVPAADGIHASAPGGDGRAADRVVEVLSRSLVGWTRTSRPPGGRRLDHPGLPRGRDAGASLRAPLPV